jgi:signal transduction histidine kinase
MTLPRAYRERHFELAGRLPRTRSIRARYTIVAKALSLVVLSMIGCVMLAAIRLSPAEASQPELGNSPVVYAGMEPPILATRGLELYIAAGILLAAALISWTTWCVVGRTLRLVSAVRARMSEISLRVPQAPGDDEIALLASTTNQTLARLEAAVEQQHHFAFMVSHELKKPVAGLRTELEVALFDLGDVDPLDTIQAALSITDRLQEIIDQLLTLARLRTIAPVAFELIDLSTLIKKEVATGVHRVPVRAHTSPHQRRGQDSR